MKYLLTLSLLLLLGGCANMVTPSGGKKDEKVPKLIKSNLSSTNFNDNHIKLEFDEFVEIENGLKNISIQPKHTTFTVSSSAKTIRIKFDSSLRKNTTYVLKISSGIKDLNEGNKYSLSYIFSTGQALDTNFITYRIKNFQDYKNIKIGLNTQTIDSVQKLKFDYLYDVTDNTISINGLGMNTTYKSWIFTDKNSDNIPDEYEPVYYDTIHLNEVREITLNNWIDSRNIKTKEYKLFTKIFKSINDENTYSLNNPVYIDKDSSLFYHINSDTLPVLDLQKELQDKLNKGLRCIKTSKDYLIILDKCGIKNLDLTGPFSYKEDENYITINSKFKIDSINLKINLIHDSLTIICNKLHYTESNKISSLKIAKTIKKDKVIMAVYQNTKLILIKKIDLTNDVQFFMNTGTYKIIFYNTDSFKNISFNLTEMRRVNCSVLEKEIILKPNWDEVLQLIFP